MQTDPVVEQSKIVRWSESPWNRSSRKGKGLWRKGFAEEPSLELRIKLLNHPASVLLRQIRRLIERLLL